MNPWDKRFERDEYIFGKKPADALAKLEHHLVHKGRTLVVADGEGLNSVFLASRCFKATSTEYSTVS